MKKCVLAANTSWYLYNMQSFLIKSLVKEGYRVVVVCPLDRYTLKLIAIGCIHENLPLNRKGKNPLDDLASTWSMYKIYKRLKPDIVLNFTPKLNIYSTIAAKLNDAFVINNITGLGTIFTKQSLSSWIARLLFRCTQPLANFLLFQNKEDRQFFLNAKYVKAEKALRIPGSGIDLERFKAKPIPQGETIRFLLVARMLRQKGVMEYVRAARRLKRKYPNVECSLLGYSDNGNPTSITADRLDKWGTFEGVRYLGGVDDVIPVIESHHCVVLPSFYREGVPRSLLEAAALARPIITTNSVGCRDVMDDEVNGFQCQPKSVDSLFAAMEKIYLSPRYRLIEMGLASRHLVEAKFDVSRVVGTYLQILKSVGRR